MHQDLFGLRKVSDHATSHGAQTDESDRFPDGL
jgi:hypothetical protein